MQMWHFGILVWVLFSCIVMIYQFCEYIINLTKEVKKKEVVAISIFISSAFCQHLNSIMCATG